MDENQSRWRVHWGPMMSFATPCPPTRWQRIKTWFWLRKWDMLDWLDDRPLGRTATVSAGVSIVVSVLMIALVENLL